MSSYDEMRRALFSERPRPSRRRSFETPIPARASAPMVRPKRGSLPSGWDPDAPTPTFNVKKRSPKFDKLQWNLHDRLLLNSSPAPPLPPPFHLPEDWLYDMVLDEEKLNQYLDGEGADCDEVYRTHKALVTDMVRMMKVIDEMTEQLETWRGNFSMDVDEAEFEAHLEFWNNTYEKCLIAEQKLFRFLYNEVDRQGKENLRRRYPFFFNIMETDLVRERLEEVHGENWRDATDWEIWNKIKHKKPLTYKAAKKMERSRRKLEKRNEKLMKKFKLMQEKNAAKVAEESLFDDVFDSADEEPESDAKLLALERLCYVAEKINNVRKEREQLEEREIKIMKKKAKRKSKGNVGPWLRERAEARHEVDYLYRKEENLKKLMASWGSEFQRAFVDPKHVQ